MTSRTQNEISAALERATINPVPAPLLPVTETPEREVTYSVRSWDHHGAAQLSTGFGSRAAAERFATGLAQSGRAVAVEIAEERS